jgi:uncharacterized protein
MRTRFLVTLGLIALAEIYSYILIRSVVRNLPSAWKIAITAIYVLLTALTWSSVFLFRRIDWAHLPHMARNIFVAFTLGFFIAKLLILAIMLIDDIRRIIMWLVFKIIPSATPASVTAAGGISRSVFLKTIALILGGTTLGGFVYGISNRYKYQVRRIKLSFPNLPASFRGLKIVQISDIHSGSFDHRHPVERGVDMVMAENADIIFFTGDLVNNKAEEIKPYMDIFSRVKAPLGVYSTLGNHDYGDYVQWDTKEMKVQNLEELKQLHGKMGWKIMMNEHTVIEKGNEKIAVIGVENWSAKANFPKYGDLGKAYSGLEGSEIPFKILLSHDPSHWDAQVNNNYKDIDLTLSGHTHGMQFGIEIPGFKWSPVKYMYRNWAGLYQQGKQYLYVNRGYGFLGYPGRLGIMPEITVIELV